jgi:hypothetical protein
MYQGFLTFCMIDGLSFWLHDIQALYTFSLLFKTRSSILGRTAKSLCGQSKDGRNNDTMVTS